MEPGRHNGQPQLRNTNAARTASEARHLVNSNINHHCTRRQWPIIDVYKCATHQHVQYMHPVVNDGQSTTYTLDKIPSETLQGISGISWAFVGGQALQRTLCPGCHWGRILSLRTRHHNAERSKQDLILGRKQISPPPNIIKRQKQM